MLLCPAHRVELLLLFATAATLNASAPPFAPPVPVLGSPWDRALRVAGPMHVRVLYRRDMLELYVNDVLMPVYLMPPTTGKVATVPGPAAARVTGLRVWDMTLPGS